MENIPIRDVMKEDFGWTIPTETLPLPSNGVVYSPDSYLFNKQSVQIRAMTAREEDILTSQAYIKEGNVIEKLLESCIIDKNIDVGQLISGDKNALMVGIRITGYGPEYPVSIACTNCGAKKDVNIKLDELPLKRIKNPPVEEGKNLFSFKLPVTQKKVMFKYLNSNDEKERELTRKRYKALGIVKESGVTDYLESVIVSIDDISDKNKISHFIKNMPVRDSSSLRKYITENEPGIDMTWKHQCDSCGHINNIRIPITSKFFWPDT